MVQVLHTDWAGDVDGAIQRVRLSPTESVLAATVKNNHSEEAKCVLVKLDHHEPQEPTLILEKVFSFGKATSHIKLEQSAFRIVKHYLSFSSTAHFFLLPKYTQLFS